MPTGDAATSPAILVRSLIGPDKLKCGDCAGYEVVAPERTHLLLVADGVGSHSHDWAASATACASVLESMRASRGDLGRRMQDAVNRAHQDVQDLRDKAAGATCTLVLAAWTEGEPLCRFVGIGDSRLYRLTAAGVEQLTADDTTRVPLSIAGEVVTSGGAVKFGSGLTRAVGYGILGEVKVSVTPLENGDMIAAVTDGFHELSGFKSRLADVYGETDMERAFAAHLDSYHALEGRDDATAVLLRRHEVDVELLAVGRALVEADRDPGPEDPPRHLLAHGLAEWLQTAAAAADYAAIGQTLEYLGAHRLVPPRHALAAVLHGFVDDGSPEAVKCYRRVYGLMERAV